MGDDFDLFPKRENLDPFSFGKKDKGSEKEKEDDADDLFGGDERPREPLPDLDIGSIPEDAPTLPDLPLTGPEPDGPPTAGKAPQPGPAAPAQTGGAPDPLESLLTEGPISEEKTFDEPTYETEEAEEAPRERSSRRSTSPFVVVGGALVIIIGLLYGALTYLKRDKPTAQPVATAPVSVPVEVPAPPQPETPAAVESGGPEAPGPEEAAGTETAEDTAAEEPPAGETTPESSQVASQPPSESPAPEAGAVPPAAGTPRYSVQVGAFILNSSVDELESRLRGLGYEPILKEGSTTAMMNMLTVGPFSDIQDARAALTRLEQAGVDTNLRRTGSGAIIYAGSYLLEENADSVMKKIRSLGYPVKLSKQEARLPMTFVRVGRYAAMDDATRAKDELKGKGLDGVVVKLQ